MSFQYTLALYPKRPDQLQGSGRPLVGPAEIVGGKDHFQRGGALFHSLKSGSSERIKQWKLRTSSLFSMIPEVCVSVCVCVCVWLLYV